MPGAAENPNSPATLARGPVGPPERLESGPLVLRRMRAYDAGDIAAVVGESLEHLRPWMPWATKEAADHRSQLQRISEADELWAAGTDYIYAIFVRESTADGAAPGTPDGERVRRAGGRDGALAGTIGLHRKAGTDVVEIGYWIAAAHTRRGYGTAAAQAMTLLAATLPGVRQVEIQVDEANVASAGIPRKLGFRLDRIEDHEPEAPGERGRRMIWLWDCANGDPRDGGG